MRVRGRACQEARALCSPRSLGPVLALDNVVAGPGVHGMLAAERQGEGSSPVCPHSSAPRGREAKVQMTRFLVDPAIYVPPKEVKVGRQ